MTLANKYYPGLNRVLVETKALPKTNSILATSTSIFSYGTIVAIGAIKDESDISENMFNLNDNVYFLAQAGINFELPEGTFRLINITDILVGQKSE